MMPAAFDHTNFHALCDDLSSRDPQLMLIREQYGYPPMWSRPNSLESLVHIILEQQVSLASALAALNKLRVAIGEVTPARILSLSDTDFRACYFSRQKMNYTRHLAAGIAEGRLNLEALALMSDADVRATLVQYKGIGNWTVDVYLMFVLQRADIFPAGDLAAINALKSIKGLAHATPRDELIEIAEAWKPYRTVATMMLWHYYLSRRRIIS